MIERAKRLTSLAFALAFGFDGISAGSGGDRFTRVGRTGLAAAGGGNGEVGLVFPGAGPGLSGPALGGDGSDRGTILVTNDFAPGSGIGGADLGGTLAHAKQSFATRGQAGN